MSYENRTGHPPDFIARYRFYPPEQGGRRSPPAQGYRCDFLYEGDAVEDGVYMIWPEFTGDDGDVLPDGMPAALEGLARMWIVSPEMRAGTHRDRLGAGTRFYFMEGARKVGEGEVTEVVGLLTNPGV